MRLSTGSLNRIECPAFAGHDNLTLTTEASCPRRDRFCTTMIRAIVIGRFPPVCMSRPRQVKVRLDHIFSDGKPRRSGYSTVAVETLKRCSHADDTHKTEYGFSECSPAPVRCRCGAPFRKRVPCDKTSLCNIDQSWAQDRLNMFAWESALPFVCSKADCPLCGVACQEVHVVGLSFARG